MKIFIIFAISFVVISIISYWNYRRMRSIALTRENSTICTYARSFDYRNVDTKIMRAVYEKVQVWVGKYEGMNFPVEANDYFNETYNMDAEDLDDIYFEIAEELGISTENPEANPYWNKVTTVKNLVLFLHNQPKIKAA
jgi:hypothetical protein